MTTDPRQSASAAATDAVRLLISRRAARRWGARIEQVFAGRPHELVLVPEPGEPPLDAGVLGSLSLAWFSRDVYVGDGDEQSLAGPRAFFGAVMRAPALRWLQVFSAGIDRPVYAQLQQRGVAVTTASGAGALAVATNVTTAVLALNRGLLDWVDAQRRHAWEPPDSARVPRDLHGQRATVVGTGPIGREIARQLAFFGLRVTGVRRRAETVEHCERVITYEALGSVLADTDWLVLACPLTDLTRGLVGREALASLPPDARVVNVARGEVVDEQALIDALRERRIAGAYLDVFAREPLDAGSPLWDLPQVLISPHMAASIASYDERVAEIFLENLGRWLDGAPLRNVAPPGVVPAAP